MTQVGVYTSRACRRRHRSSRLRLARDVV